MSLLLVASLIGIYVATRVVSVLSQESFLDYVDWLQSKTEVSNAAAGELFQALGTSAPEVAINLYAVYAVTANPAVGIATIIGSAIFQITVVLAVPFFVSDDQRIDPHVVGRSIGFYAVSVIALLIFAYDSVFNAWELLLLVALYAGYAALLLDDTTTTTSSTTDKQPEPSHPWIAALDRPVRRVSEAVDAWIPRPDDTWLGFAVVIGLIGMFSAVTVELAELAAALAGLPAAFIAVTVLAAGSSVPEIASNLAKARKGSLNQVFGNALGSNSFDVLISFGGVSVVAAWLRGGLVIPGESSIFIAASILFASLCSVIAVLWVSRWRASRRAGIGLLAVYVVAISAYYVLL
jgi:Ca2+/Na+ antiporter